MVPNKLDVRRERNFLGKLDEIVDKRVDERGF